MKLSSEIRVFFKICNMCMKDQDKKQILALIDTFVEQRTYVPFLEDFLKHPNYGPLFKSFSAEETKQVWKIINTYIEDKINGLRTKGWQYFQRFYETKNADFRKFRELNSDEKKLETTEFHKLWKEIEQELFRFEWLLTESMLNRPEALDKVVWAFYNIVYNYFPLFGRINADQ